MEEQDRGRQNANGSMRTGSLCIVDRDFAALADCVSACPMFFQAIGGLSINDCCGALLGS